MTTKTNYCDSSALVKRYVSEAGSEWIKALCSDSTQIIALADIGRVEIAAAFAGKLRGNAIKPADYQKAATSLAADVQSHYQVIPITSQRIDEAITLTARRKLRGYDAVHLACALYLNQALSANNLAPLTFISADDDLLQAAQAEGLAMKNPNLH